jgi:hypothetical protein
MTPRTRARVALALVLSLTSAACTHKPLVLVAQAGQTLAGSIRQAQVATKQLTEGAVLTPRQALPVQRALVRANDRLKPLPDLLIAIDKATQQGQPDAARIAAALDILRAVGVDIDEVVAGLPVGQTAAQVLQAATEARKLIAQITDALARRKSAALRREVLHGGREYLAA